MKEKALYRLIEYVSAAVFLGILVVITLIDNRFFYVYQTFCKVPNVVVVAILSLGICTYYGYRKKVKKDRTKREGEEDFVRGKRYDRIVLAVLSVAFFAIQILVSWQIFFKTGWDCGQLVKMAQSIAFDHGTIGNDHYFSIYPNNILLVSVFVLILRLVGFLGISADYFPLVVVGCLLVNLAGFFMAECVRTVTQSRKLMIAAWLIYMLLVGLSPWNSVPYSDTYSIIFPILCIWLFIHKEGKNPYVVWGMIGFFSWIGYYIKPTVVLVLLVLGCVQAWHSFVAIVMEKREKSLRRFLGGALTVLGAVFLAAGINHLARETMGCQLDEHKRFTPIHYLMMGLNYSTGGTYDQWDVNFSAGAPDVKSRNEQDIQEIKSRLAGMGVKGTCIHYVRKLMTNFNDGTFAWGHEGEFYWYLQDRDNALAAFLRSYYYEDGELFFLFQIIAQMLWMTVLCMLPFLVLPEQEGQEHIGAAVTLSLLAIICFVMLFEARARYLFLYSPVFVLGASIGAKRLIEAIRVKAGKSLDK